MKKITFLLLFLIACTAINYGQCTNANAFSSDPIPANNYGEVQEISTCINTGYYVAVSDIIIGGDYIFTCVGNDENMANKYITVTDSDDNLIAHGTSPLTVEDISVPVIRVHYTENISCSAESNCNIVTLKAILSCPVPTDIQISAVTTTGASFAWTPGETDAWQVLVLPEAADAPDAATSGTPVNNDPLYSINTLTTGGHYKFYIRSDCGSEYSPWRGPYHFASACEQIEAFNENFENTEADGVPECWTSLMVGTSQYATLGAVGFNAHSGSNAIQISNADSPPTSKLMLVSPPLSTVGTSTHRVKFFARGYGNVTLEVGTVDTMTADATFSLLQTISVTDVYTEFVVDFTQYSGTDTFIAFRHPGLTPYNPIFLDDIRWELAPLCPDISNITVETLTTASATISWTPGGPETQWDVVYGPVSTENPDSLTPVSPAPADTPEATISGLDPNTEYKAWVRSYCGASLGNGVWIGPVTFTTSCLPTGLLSQDFDTTDYGDLPECWSSIMTGTTVSNNAVVQVVTNSGMSGSNAVRIYNADSSSDSDFILVSPNLNTLATSDHRLKFYARSEGPGTIEVGTMGNPAGAETFTAFQSIETTGNYVEYTVDFTEYIGTDTYVGIRSASGIFVGIYLDDVRWELTPLCPDVTQIIASNVTDGAASLGWASNGTETQWDVVYGAETVTDPDTLTPISPAPSVNPQAALSGLAYDTTYNVWVRSVCGGTAGNGAWIGPYKFKTACQPAGELNEGFETTDNGSVPHCWSALLYGPTIAQYAAVRVVNSDPASGVNSVELWTGDSAATDYIMLVTPYLNTIATATHILKFSAFSYGSSALSVGTMNGNTSNAVFSAYQPIAVGQEHVEYTVDFTGYTGTDTYLALRNVSGPNQSIFVDDIRWEPALGTPDIANTAFSYYPNPVKDVLQLSYSDNITNVTVFNLLGQKVLENSTNSKTAAVDMSGLPGGNYIVKVMADAMIKTIKVIKE